jgi:hypothetical protein
MSTQKSHHRLCWGGSRGLTDPGVDDAGIDASACHSQRLENQNEGPNHLRYPMMKQKLDTGPSQTIQTKKEVSPYAKQARLIEELSQIQGVLKHPDNWLTRLKLEDPESEPQVLMRRLTQRRDEILDHKLMRMESFEEPLPGTPESVSPGWAPQPTWGPEGQPGYVRASQVLMIERKEHEDNDTTTLSSSPWLRRSSWVDSLSFAMRINDKKHWYSFDSPDSFTRTYLLLYEIPPPAEGAGRLFWRAWVRTYIQYWFNGEQGSFRPYYVWGECKNLNEIEDQLHLGAVTVGGSVYASGGDGDMGIWDNTTSDPYGEPYPGFRFDSGFYMDIQTYTAGDRVIVFFGVEIELSALGGWSQAKSGYWWTHPFQAINIAAPWMADESRPGIAYAWYPA